MLMESSIVPRRVFGFCEIPDASEYVLCNASVPAVCLPDSTAGFDRDSDDLVRCNIHVADGRIAKISNACPSTGATAVDLQGGCVFPAFADLHTHIDKSHSCERSRNPTGNLSGADSSTARDASFWDRDDVFWYASLRRSCARPLALPDLQMRASGMQAHGLQRALRVRARHVCAAHASHQHGPEAGGADVACVRAAARQVEGPGARRGAAGGRARCHTLCFGVSAKWLAASSSTLPHTRRTLPTRRWRAWHSGRARARLQVELQGVSLVTLSFFRDDDAGAALADTVAAAGGILGAAVCCTHRGGLPDDDATTCESDRHALLDRIFELAKARGLLLDFHVDENGNEVSRGLRDIARKTQQHGYGGMVVCGHCWCAPSLAVRLQQARQQSTRCF
jgi:cytosine/adenosine deaminase-related metal-dependent hydrolase